MPTLPDGTHLPYPGDPGFDQLPPDLMQAILAAVGGGGGGQEQAQPTDRVGEAINLLHQEMQAEQDPKRISMLAAIFNQLTTDQANRAQATQGK